jgi:hypothetical protein
MSQISFSHFSRKSKSAIVAFVAFIAIVAGAWTFLFQAKTPIKNMLEQWGDITAPVFNVPEQSEGYKGEGADLFASPDKFSNDKDGPNCNYSSGVLPNGRIVKPAGKCAQIGMNPLGSVLTAVGRY